MPKALIFPATADDIHEVMDGFESMMHLPSCAGAIDSTLVYINQHKHFGNKYFCYKKCYFFLLLAAVDSQERFMWVETGAAGGQGDASVERIWHEWRLNG